LRPEKIPSDQLARLMQATLHGAVFLILALCRLGDRRFCKFAPQCLREGMRGQGLERRRRVDPRRRISSSDELWFERIIVQRFGIKPCPSRPRPPISAPRRPSQYRASCRAMPAPNLPGQLALEEEPLARPRRFWHIARNRRAKIRCTFWRRLAPRGKFMPTKTLPKQTGNSCAAHCVVIAVAEITGRVMACKKNIAENVLWPSFRFVDNGSKSPGLAALVQNQHSDPRKIVAWVNNLDGGRAKEEIQASLVCDATSKAAAVGFLKTQALRDALLPVFDEMLHDSTAEPNLQIQDGNFYSATYLSFSDPSAAKGDYTGTHNILVTKEKGSIYYYNPNEDAPAWKTTVDWRKLEGQNDNKRSYVFTGVCLVMKKP
jgi:hypothetical protein